MSNLSCPHCGNNLTKWIQDNGLPLDHHDCTLLCVKPCSREESSDDDPIPYLTDAEYVCGMQWQPNQES